MQVVGSDASYLGYADRAAFATSGSASCSSLAVYRGGILLCIAHAADEEMNGHSGVDGDAVPAPTAAQNAEVTPIDRKGRLEAGKVSDAGHHTRADQLDGYVDAFRYAVNR